MMNGSMCTVSMDDKLSAKNADIFITSTVDTSSDTVVCSQHPLKTCSKGQNRCLSQRPESGCLHDTHPCRSLFSEGNSLVTLVTYIKAFVVSTKQHVLEVTKDCSATISQSESVETN